MYSLKLYPCSDVIHDALTSMLAIIVYILPKLLTLLRLRTWHSMLLKWNCDDHFQKFSELTQVKNGGDAPNQSGITFQIKGYLSHKAIFCYKVALDV